jgi:tripartite-type tricarboxylate transporter receptor subunit TctC
MIYVAPYGLPADVHKVLSEAMGKTIRDPGFVEQIGRGKMTVDFLTSEGVQKYISGLSKVLPRYIEETRQTLGK